MSAEAGGGKKRERGRPGPYSQKALREMLQYASSHKGQDWTDGEAWEHAMEHDTTFPTELQSRTGTGLARRYVRLTREEAESDSDSGVELDSEYVSEFDVQSHSGESEEEKDTENQAEDGAIVVSKRKKHAGFVWSASKKASAPGDRIPIQLRPLPEQQQSETPLSDKKVLRLKVTPLQFHIPSPGRVPDGTAAPASVESSATCPSAFCGCASCLQQCEDARLAWEAYQEEVQAESACSMAEKRLQATEQRLKDVRGSAEQAAKTAKEAKKTLEELEQAPAMLRRYAVSGAEGAVQDEEARKWYADQMVRLKEKKRFPSLISVQRTAEARRRRCEILQAKLRKTEQEEKQEQEQLQAAKQRSAKARKVMETRRENQIRKRGKSFDMHNFLFMGSVLSERHGKKQRHQEEESNKEKKQ